MIATHRGAGLGFLLFCCTTACHAPAEPAMRAARTEAARQAAQEELTAAQQLERDLRLAMSESGRRLAALQPRLRAAQAEEQQAIAQLDATLERLGRLEAEQKEAQQGLTAVQQELSAIAERERRAAASADESRRLDAELKELAGTLAHKRAAHAQATTAMQAQIAEAEALLQQVTVAQQALASALQAARAAAPAKPAEPAGQGK